MSKQITRSLGLPAGPVRPYYAEALKDRCKWAGRTGPEYEGPVMDPGWIRVMRRRWMMRARERGLMGPG